MGLSDAPKPLNPCSVPVLGRIPEPAATIALGYMSPFLPHSAIHCVQKNLLGHNQLHSPGHKSRVRSGCSVSSANLEFIEVFPSPPTGKKKKTTHKTNHSGFMQQVGRLYLMPEAAAVAGGCNAVERCVG